ncbi:polysaccharide deacetylase [Nitratireductor sp. ZSWI3]|uniref:polysaccharide deacetylase n=1 Tax=Nitratireductor sp. ZSWI3 TaxID=2966359 RepID=UPI00214F9843|nr:polysaccharide deacetylase [Nitratireductor sp. ZSWI3]MCR4268626.1 polysaccharide deacetylase [Nitratireductor sp. ZSWI3]
MLKFLCAGAAALALTAPSFANGGAAASPRAPQYVIVSFDGALHLEQWERSRALGRETGARFTYFLSCVYLLSSQTRQTYQAPGMARGRSNVGYGYSREDVAGRLSQIWSARAEGHDIANHACGHFDGKDWSAADWESEFDQFTKIVSDAWKLNGIDGEPAGWRNFVRSEIRGFRAPYLSTNKALYRALETRGFAYDASGVSRGPALPTRGDVMRFSLPLIPEGPREKQVIAMDYNLYVRHSGGKEKPEKASSFEERAYEAFLTSFRKQYEGKRTPVQLGFHFTLMNDGAYWNALERFTREVCVRQDVRCVSYRDYIAQISGKAERGASSAGGGT